MKEKKLTDEQDNLLIEFDGYGFAPTITMPNSEEYAIEWKKRLIRVFDRQKAEIERLTEENKAIRINCENARNITGQMFDKNDELQKQVDEYKNLYETMYRKYSDLSNKEFNCEALRKEKNEYFDKAVELQKQVDELTERAERAEEIANVYQSESTTKCWVDYAVKQAVKDAAKEIYEEIDKSDILVVQTQEYGEIEVVPIERLKEIINKKGVEVE